MTGFPFVAVLAAQAAIQTGAPPAPAATTPAETTAQRSIGETTYVDLDAGGGYSTNPFIQVPSKGGGFGRVSAHAVHTLVTDRTTTVVSGFAQSVFYTSHYSSAQSFDLDGRHDAAVSENLRLYVDGDLAYDRGGQLDTRILAIPNVPLLPGVTVPPGLLGPGSDFLTVRGRTFRANADAGGQLKLDPRDNMDFSSGLSHSTFKSGSFETHYTTIPVAIGYERQLSENTNVGARLAAQFSHFSGNGSNGSHDFRVITPELTGQVRLSEQLTFTGDIGVSFAAVDEVTGTHHSTGLAGDANLCSISDRSQICARASLQQEAATSAGPARNLTVSLDYSRQLSADETLQLSVSANRYSNPTLFVSVPTFSHATYIRAAADYSRRLGARLFGGVNLAARKIAQSGLSPDADLSAAVFIRYRIGDVR